MSKHPEEKAARGGQFGEAGYRAGALQRIGESYLMLRTGHFAGSIYLAGRAVEGMLRAVIWKSDAEIRQGAKSLETGHDLRELLTVVVRAGLTRFDEQDDAFRARVQHVGKLWFNNMRFASSRLVETRRRIAGEVHKRHTLKQAARSFFETSSAIVKRCEVLCQK